MFTCSDVIEMLLSFFDCESCEEFVDLWSAFATLHEHGLIDDECWSIFFPYALDFYYDLDLDRVARNH